jgi:hypothetical protein
MKRLTFCLLFAMLALAGCGGSSATRTDYGAAGATRSEQPSEAPRAGSVWTNDPNFIAPAL